MPRITLSELAANPLKFSPEEKAKLEALTDEQIALACEQVGDAPLWSDEMLDRAVKGRFLRQLREKLSLSQIEFADRFQIDLAALREWEQGLIAPDATMMAYLKVIAYSPETVVLALAG